MSQSSGTNKISDVERYIRAACAMQTGVAFEMDYNTGPTDPKHLRVGVNSAQVNNAAIAKLLIDKGIITPAEYEKTIADEMEHEVSRYTQLLEQLTGKKVTLL